MSLHWRFVTQIDGNIIKRYNTKQTLKDIIARKRADYNLTLSVIVYTHIFRCKECHCFVHIYVSKDWSNKTQDSDQQKLNTCWIEYHDHARTCTQWDTPSLYIQITTTTDVMQLWWYKAKLAHYRTNPLCKGISHVTFLNGTYCVVIER